MYLYTITPIDLWDGLRPWTEYVKEKVVHMIDPPANSWYGFSGKHDEAERIATELRAAGEGLLKAIHLARQHSSWEGDGEWMVGALPAEVEVTCFYVVKQSNNGTTYIVSPHRMPQLDHVIVEPTKEIS